jgi:hypothetical protein
MSCKAWQGLLDAGLHAQTLCTDASKQLIYVECSRSLCLPFLTAKLGRHPFLRLWNSTLLQINTSDQRAVQRTTYKAIASVQPFRLQVARNSTIETYS